MKINGQEVDMQKIVSMIEKQMPRRQKGSTIKKINDWWYSTAGLIEREKRAESMSQKIKNGTHRQKIKFTLINTADETEIIKLVGLKEVAKFLGYKNWNSSMNVSVRMNKTKTKEYKIIRED